MWCSAVFMMDKNKVLLLFGYSFKYHVWLWPIALAVVCFFLDHSIVIYGFLDQRFENLAIIAFGFADWWDTSGSLSKNITCTVLVGLLGERMIWETSDSKVLVFRVSVGSKWRSSLRNKIRTARTRHSKNKYTVQKCYYLGVVSSQMISDCWPPRKWPTVLCFSIYSSWYFRGTSFFNCLEKSRRAGSIQTCRKPLNGAKNSKTTVCVDPPGL